MDLPPPYALYVCLCGSISSLSVENPRKVGKVLTVQTPFLSHC
jgi:hypothetical protein